MAFDRALNSIKILTSLNSLISGLRHDLFYMFLHRRTNDLADLGDSSESCNWTIRTANLNSDSVVYSAGIGRDISFEHALADQYGMKVILLDPSPTGIETMKNKKNQRDLFDFLPVALAGHNGDLFLSPPGNPEEGSWVSETKQVTMDESDTNLIKVKCESISSLMFKYNHSHIDLLKIDIEGAEYAVLESVLDSGARIIQIAVEFHNGVLPGISRSQTIKTLIKLYRHGYRIVHKGGSNHTLCLVTEL
jgi:FkbM family methyltransferase